MCEVVTLAAVAGGVGMAQTAYSISAQAMQAKAQNAAISAQLDITNEEARRKATAEIFDASRATRREQERIRAAVGGSRVGPHGLGRCSAVRHRHAGGAELRPLSRQSRKPHDCQRGRSERGLLERQQPECLVGWFAAWGVRSQWMVGH